MMEMFGIEVPEPVSQCLSNLTSIKIDSGTEKGANGFVFFGENKILGRRVALKFYYYGSDAHEEVQLLAQMKHENIVQVLDAQVIGAQWAYFVTPESSFGDLDHYICSQEFSLRDSVNIIRGVLSGLGAMHSAPANLVHRDLKTANILLDEGKRPLIADFGSVKKIPDGNVSVTGSRHAALYRPPESFADNLYTYASDIYQVGMIFYQLLGGYLPYNAEAWLSKVDATKYSRLSDNFSRSKFIDDVLFRKCSRGKLLDLQSVWPFTPRGLLRILKLATHPDLRRRPQSSAEFLLALHTVGDIPDWKVVDGVFTLSLGSQEYRIVENGRSGYICEKCSVTGKWRKYSAVSGGEKAQVIQALMNALGIA